MEAYSRCFCDNEANGFLCSVFRERTWVIQVCEEFSYTNTITTASARTISVFIKNTGPLPILANIQNSPDGCTFVDDPQILNLGAGETGVLVPYHFSKRMRIAIQSEIGQSEAKIWFQMQEYNYQSYRMNNQR